MAGFLGRAQEDIVQHRPTKEPNADIKREIDIRVFGHEGSRQLEGQRPTVKEEDNVGIFDYGGLESLYCLQIARFRIGVEHNDPLNLIHNLEDRLRCGTLVVDGRVLCWGKTGLTYTLEESLRLEITAQDRLTVASQIGDSVGLKQGNDAVPGASGKGQNNRHIPV